jgi:hypothetical protein
MSKRYSGLDSDPNSIFKASRNVVKIINKKMKKDEADRLKAEQATSDVGVTLPSKSSGVLSTNISKDLSLFSLQIKQLTSMMDSFTDYINEDYNGNFLGQAWDYLLKKEKEEEEEEEEEESYYDPFQSSVHTGVSEPKRRIVGSQINNAPVQEEEEEEEEGKEGDSVGYQSDLTGSFEEFEFENEDGKSKTKKSSTSGITFLSRELTRISNLTDVATANWEDNISPNIRSLSQNKTISFFKNFKKFEESVDEFNAFKNSKKIDDEYFKLKRVFDNTLIDINNLFNRVKSEVGIVSGISKGMMGSDSAIIRDLSVVKSDIVKITKLMHSYEEAGDIKSLNEVVRKTNDAIIFWENNISPNVASLSKPDITKFLNSDFFITFDKYLTILIDIESNFRHGEQPEVGRVLQFAIDKLGEFIQLIGVDVEKINSISGGRMTGAGYLHVPTAYNRQLEYSDKKYLM